jgi:hypothetical protein
MRGYDPCGIMATKLGECAVLCPACPQPGLNLEEGWKDVPPEWRCGRVRLRLFLLINNIRYLNRLFLAINANFCLKWRNVSSEATDPSFSAGWSYFVSKSNYKAYPEEFSDLIVQKVSC